VTIGHWLGANGARSNVIFQPVMKHYRIGNMDEIVEPQDPDNLARAYLKQLRQQPRSVVVNQSPGLQAWRELEERLMLGQAPNEPNEANRPAQLRLPTPSRTPTIQDAKKAQSIWNRPISDFWRK